MLSKNNPKKEKKWIIKSVSTPESEVAIREISDRLSLHPVVARLLYNRGYTDVASAKSFLYMESEILCNPFDMLGIDAAVDRIYRAVESDELITIYGDYDVDGVTSVCTLYLYLQSLGARVNYYIPNRNGEGYGVSVSAITAIRDSGSTLIITVDTGITANEEIEHARSIGVDVVVTDHHECRSDLPRAVAVVNPHQPNCPYPFKELAGVGVVFKLVCAYEERVFKKSRFKAAEKIFAEYADLVAIGTIADVMPIKSENRIIVSYGLQMIDNSHRTGLVALMEAASSKSDSGKADRRQRKTKTTSGYIGYTIAPRINAAGRIKSAGMAVELFLSTDYKHALEIAEGLCRANKERQAEENKIMQEAYKKIEQIDVDSNPVIVLDADNWHHGVIGIVASRITEKYCLPSILISFDGGMGDSPSPDDVGKGSGRSIKGINLVDALVHCSDHLLKYGGHELAAGLSVKRGELDSFRKKINEYANACLESVDVTPVFETDFEISFSDANLVLAEQLQKLEPYGVGNPVPTFVMRGVTISEIAGVSDGKHTRFTFSDGRNFLSAMYFSNSPASTGVYVGDTVDILFNIDINNWMGRKSLQIIIRDINVVASQKMICELEEQRFEEIHHGAEFTQDENVLPTRDDFALVYTFMLNSYRAGNDLLKHREILSRLSCGKNGSSIGYIKLKFVIMILKELNIVNIDEPEPEVYKIRVHYSSSKTDLEKSSLLRKLRSQQRQNK